MKKLLYILLFSCGSLFAQNSSLFEQATTAYSEGDYQTAIANYEQILDNGQTSVAVYYNLANAHYKLDHIAPSIYYYEKALQLAPNDEDVQNNLAFAEKMTIDAIEPIPESGFSKWWNELTSLLNFDGWAWSAVACFLLFSILILAYYFAASPRKKRLFFGFGILFLFLGIVSVIFAETRFARGQNTQFAIVYAQEATVKAEPNLRSAETFKLHEGTKVSIEATFSDWFQIEIANGKQGWIEKGELRKL